MAFPATPDNECFLHDAYSYQLRDDDAAQAQVYPVEEH
jgi:hypothetical protein